MRSATRRERSAAAVLFGYVALWTLYAAMKLGHSQIRHSVIFGVLRDAVPDFGGKRPRTVA